MTTVDAPEELSPVGLTPPVPAYLRTVWKRREFATENALGQLRGEHAETALGNLWHVLNPTLLVAVYYVVFGILLETDRGLDNFIAYLAIGIFSFNYSSRSLITSSRAIASNLNLIRSLQFPRALLPASEVTRETIAYAPQVLVVLTVLIATGEEPATLWLAVVPVIMIQCVFNFGMAFFIARVGNKFRDIQKALPFIMRLALYGSGVLYSVDRFVSHPVVEASFQLNPFYVYLTLMRSYFLPNAEQVNLTILWISASIWAVSALFIGVLFFRAGEEHYGRE